MNSASSFKEFSRLVRSDFGRYARHTLTLNPGGAPNLRLALDTVLFKAGFQAAFLYRLSHWLFQNRRILLARSIMRLNLALCGADIGFAADIGEELLLGHPIGVVIGHKTRIGRRATILGGVLFGVKSWTPMGVGQLPQAGDDCVFCARSSILGECVVGDAVVVGINAVVDTDVPSGAFATGSPLEILPGRGKEMIASWCLQSGPVELAHP